MKKMITTLSLGCMFFLATWASATEPTIEVPGATAESFKLSQPWGSPDMIVPLNNGSQLVCYNHHMPQQDTYRCFIADQEKVKDIGFRTKEDILILGAKFFEKL
ncbi:MAG: hypothetical protein ACOWYE_12260 [Desulfatiglandales bacterium]